ncbi:hypothetical protein ACQPXM_11765 [Kribbella sp. CA-253562]|uniref:hypothetical protein n=1 Tax=Kribbella sp. CA-253562 TaxID=3239942 RepID=UPI003D8E6B20
MSSQMSGEILETFTWLQTVIAADPILAATQYKVIDHAGQLTVQVMGSHREARAWGSAIGGIIRPSRIDALGVRHKLVVGRHVIVDVVEHLHGAADCWVSSRGDGPDRIGLSSNEM